ncbi:hypothetical protein GCM10023094_43860 [Rhodococcus olei]|uniref:Uncharacterized protein n=1 Tax=Rhodococcus olei TaxID=2161675 RepID=A0ABP8PHW4_9NOCA
MTPTPTPPEKPVVLAPDAPAAPEHTQAIPALRRAVLAKADADRKAAAEKAAAEKAAAEKAAAGKGVAEKTPAVTKAAPVIRATPVAKVAPVATATPPAEAPAEKTQVVGKVAAAAAEPPATQPAAAVTPPPPPVAKTGFPRPPQVREPALLSGQSLEADLLRQARTSRDESLDEARALVHTTGEFPRITDAPAGEKAGADASTATGSSEAVAPADEGEAAPATGAVRQWLVLAGQAVVAIVAGALLFKGFEKLWESLPWVALVLAVLVIAGLVAVVRILRQTEDLLSLLIAVIVGVFVTIGPLVFVLSSS